MIPKKRYLYESNMQHLPDLSPRYPFLPTYQEQATTPHTESDVSVAMILANGFGQKRDTRSTSACDNCEEV